MISQLYKHIRENPIFNKLTDADIKDSFYINSSNKIVCIIPNDSYFPNDFSNSTHMLMELDNKDIIRYSVFFDGDGYEHYDKVNYNTFSNLNLL